MHVLRWLAVSFVILLVLLAVILLRKPSWPKADPPPNVAADFVRKCDVTRDTFDVAHIQAKSDEALMYCWGRIQASDRAWQMDYLRRLAYGRLAELYGMKFLRQDFFLRLLKLGSTSAAWVKSMIKSHPKEYRLARFYVWGVNDGFKALGKGKKRPYYWRGKYKSYQPPAWRIHDTLAIALLQSFYQTRRNFTDDIKHERLRLGLGMKRYTELYGRKDRLHRKDHLIIKPGEHEMAPVQTPPSSKPKAPVAPERTRPAPPRRTQVSPQERRWKMARLEALRKWVGPLGQVTGEGSNNWSVGASKSASGFAMLANDPHLTISTPAFWYEVHLKSPSYDTLGFGVPGTPSIMSGNNRFVAWGVTNGFSNSADVIRIKVNSSGLFQLGKKKMKVKPLKPTVYARIGPFYLPIFWKSFEQTDVGPILPLSWKQGEKLLFRWTGYHIKRSPLVPSIQVLQARSVKHIDAIFQTWELPCWNMVFADHNGSYGYRQIGLVARRTAGTHGMIDGSDEAQVWKGTLKPNEMPFVADKPRGYVATANNRTFPMNYPLYVGHNFAPGYRARRIEEMLEQKPKLTLEDMKRTQLDVLSPMAVLMLPDMLKRVREGNPTFSPNASKALKVLASWNKRADRDQVGPTLFRLWVHWLEQVMFFDDAKKANPKGRSPKAVDAPKKLQVQAKGLKVKPGPYAMLDVMRGRIKPGSSLSVSKLLQLTLEKSVNQLKRQLKGDLTSWTWGKYHQNPFFHLSGGSSKFRPQPQGKDGDEYTVNVAQHRGHGPFVVRNASSLRLLVEMSKPRIKSMVVLAGKQIDKEPSKLGPQQKLWLNNQYRVRPYYPDEIKKHTKSKFTISW